ncbi:MAG: hypothetical protein LQ345_004174 [Seirophora villosa]|nr:MAG: hypothetical protein LQ345_004174 [Seirophora villosa]
MTIRAFLKKILTEREKAQKKQAADKPTANLSAIPAPELSEQPSTAVSSHSTATYIPNEPQASGEAASTSALAVPSKPVAERETVPTEAQKDVPQPSIEATEDRVREESFQEQDRGDAAASNLVGKPQNGSQHPTGSQNVQAPVTANGRGAGQGIDGTTLGFDGMTGGFPNMAFANPADFQSMMQFMPNNAMGGFPNMMGMPGMPGMGMDPMQAMSQGMFGGFGGPGMGVNGINAGMEFPAGQMWNGGFNGQPGSWMSGQDKFNQNGYGGHANGMGGDFGANAGYAGYNMPSHQGNYNQMNQQQFPNHDFQNGHHGQGFHNRGRGRGRGYHPYAPRGRGGYNQVTNGSHTNHEPIHNQIPQFPRQHNSYPQNPQQVEDAEKQQVDEFGRDISGLAKTKEATDDEIARAMAPGDADEIESPEAPATTGTQETPATMVPNDELPKASDEAPTSIQDSEKQDSESDKQIDQPQEYNKPALIETPLSDDPSRAELTSPSSAVAEKTMMPPPTPYIPQAPRSSSLSENVPRGPSARGQANVRDHSRGSSVSGGTGGRRGSTHAHDETSNHVRPGFQPGAVPINAPLEPKGMGVEGAPKGPRAMREGLPNTGIRGGRGFLIVGRAASAAHGRSSGDVRSRSASPTRSRSPSKHGSHRHRSRRHRSLSRSEESSERERRRERHERHKRRSRKHEGSEEEKDGYTSPAHQSSSHRSRRDRSAGRDEDHKSHHRSHRSRRESDRDGENRSTRKRSRTPSPRDNGKDVDPAPHPSTSSRKRHERDQDHEDEDELTRRDRKRSRRDHAEEAKLASRKEGEDENQHHRDRKRSRRDNAEDRSALTNHARDEKSSHHPVSSSRHATARECTPPASKSAIPPTKQLDAESKPAMDPHELERQARNKERLQKELQRREAMEGKGPQGSKSNGAGGGALGRRVSYKYEDELEGHNRAEREREAGRWR